MGGNFSATEALSFSTPAKFPQDNFDNTLDVLADFVAPKPYNFISSRLQPPRPPFILDRQFGVLASVNLDDQFLRKADEIDHVWPDWCLPTETKPSNLLVPQFPPQRSFSVGEVLPKRSRGFQRHGASLAAFPGCAAPPTLTLPLKGGGNAAAPGPESSPPPLRGRGRVRVGG